MLPGIKLYCKPIVIKTAWYWHKNRQTDQWNSTDNTEINPHLQSQLIFDKRCKHIQWAKGSLFNKWCWENWTNTCRKMKLDHLLTPHTKVNSKQIKDLNVRFPNHKNCRRKHRQQNLGHSLQQYFIGYISLGKRDKRKNNKWDYIKLKSFCTAK